MDLTTKRAEYYDSYVIDCPDHWKVIRLVLIVYIRVNIYNMYMSVHVNMYD